MTNKEYQENIEKDYGKPLKEVMHDLCVVQNIYPSDGAKILGVPENTFRYWKNHFRLGPIQRSCDAAEERRKKDNTQYKMQLSQIDITRPFNYSNEKSLTSFKEFVERYFELTKAKKIIYSQTESDFGEMTFMLEIAKFESILQFIDKYLSEDLYSQFLQEAKFIKEQFDSSIKSN